MVCDPLIFKKGRFCEKVYDHTAEPTDDSAHALENTQEKKSVASTPWLTGKELTVIFFLVFSSSKLRFVFNLSPAVHFPNLYYTNDCF